MWWCCGGRECGDVASTNSNEKIIPFLLPPSDRLDSGSTNSGTPNARGQHPITQGGPEAGVPEVGSEVGGTCEMPDAPPTTYFGTSDLPLEVAFVGDSSCTFSMGPLVDHILEESERWEERGESVVAGYYTYIYTHIQKCCCCCQGISVQNLLSMILSS